MHDVPGDRQPSGGRRRGRHLTAGEESEGSKAQNCRGGILRTRGEGPGEDRTQEYRDVSACFYEARSTEHLIAAKMLWKDRVFDRPKKGRVDSHRKERREHERNACEHEPGSPHDHDENLSELDDADQPGLVVIVGELPGKGRQEEKRKDEERLRYGAELELFGRVLEQLVGDEQNHGLFEQAVVERAQELGRKQREEPPRSQQVGYVLDQ